MNSAQAPDVVGVWGDTASETLPSLEFTGDGKVSGTDGCNSIAGSYSQTDQYIEFNELISTLMACENVDAWLNQADHATISDETLTFFDSSDTEIGDLERSE